LYAEKIEYMGKLIPQDKCGETTISVFKQTGRELRVLCTHRWTGLRNKEIAH
jgi:hypothetical protein